VVGLVAQSCSFSAGKNTLAVNKHNASSLTAILISFTPSIQRVKELNHSHAYVIGCIKLLIAVGDVRNSLQTMSKIHAKRAAGDGLSASACWLLRCPATRHKQAVPVWLRAEEAFTEGGSDSGDEVDPSEEDLSDEDLGIMGGVHDGEPSDDEDDSGG
jgi:hypothetical protein